MRLQDRRPQLRNFAAAAAVGSERCRSQVIAEQVGQRPRIALTHRHPLTAGVVVFDHRARTTGPLEVGADVAGGHAVRRGFDAVVDAFTSTYSKSLVVTNGGKLIPNSTIERANAKAKA